MRVPIYPPFSLLPVNVRLADEFTDGRETTPLENSTRRIDPTAIRGAGRKLEASRHPESNEQNSGSGYPGAGSNAASSGLGNVATDPGGIATGGGLSTDSGAGPLGKGAPPGSGSGGATSGQVKSAPKGASDGAPATDANSAHPRDGSGRRFRANGHSGQLGGTLRRPGLRPVDE